MCGALPPKPVSLSIEPNGSSSWWCLWCLVREPVHAPRATQRMYARQIALHPSTKETTPMPETDDIYTRLEIQPVINATGHVTILGGSVLSPAVQAAMAAANRSFAAMQEVHNHTGSLIAGMLGVENAVVTSGCCAALVAMDAPRPRVTRAYPSAAVLPPAHGRDRYIRCVPSRPRSGSNGGTLPRKPRTHAGFPDRPGTWRRTWIAS